MAAAKRNHKVSGGEETEFRRRMLDWYDQEGRDLPWRSKGGLRPDPYHVWLSEIMLQQTTVAAVQSYFLKFLAKWPTIHDLADAPAADIMAAWAGLGYYARARNLHACAKIVSEKLNGVFPQEQTALQKLPGIGEYTSAAIRAIAFNKPATVVDGNIERVTARYFAVTEPLPAARALLKSLAARFFAGGEDRPGDLAQALMDHGATICIPSTPRCPLCPVIDGCEAYRQGLQNQIPYRMAKKPRPSRMGEVYWVMNRQGKVLLQKRAAKGLLGSMTGLPTSDWLDSAEGVVVQVPAFFKNMNIRDLQTVGISVRHIFTHFELTLALKIVEAADNMSVPEGYYWADRTQLSEVGFPSLFKKALALFEGQKPFMEKSG